MTPRRLDLVLAALLTALPLSGCGGGGGGAAGPGPGTAIGPAGGTVTGPQGATLVVPPGALQATVALRIEVAAPAALPAAVSGVKAAGAAFTVTPHGQVFSTPATLRIPYDAAALAPGEAVALLTAPDGGTWSLVDGATADGAFLEASVMHLSHFTPGAPMALRRLSGLCGLSYGGELWCWGQQGLGGYQDWSTPHRFPSDLAFTELTAGNATICAIGPLGRVYCLGSDNGTAAPSEAFTQIASDLSFRQVTGFNMHFCGVAEATSEAWCWGSNLRGQLGTGQAGSLYDSRTPVKLGGAFATTGWASLAAGGQFTCGVTNGGELFCWGDNTYRTLGQPIGEYTGTPTSLGTGYSKVWAGGTHACALNGTELRCWGLNSYGQVGDGTGCNGSTPCVNNLKNVTAVAGLLPATGDAAAVAIAADHTCARTSSATTACWGYTYLGATGSSTWPPPASQQLAPAAVAGGFDYMTLAAREHTTCGITSAGQARCWGANLHGELCRGTVDTDPHPTSAPMKLTGLP